MATLARLVFPFVSISYVTTSLAPSNAQNLAIFHIDGLSHSDRNGETLDAALGATAASHRAHKFNPALTHIETGIVGSVSPTNSPALDVRLSGFCPAILRSTSAPFISLCILL